MEISTHGAVTHEFFIKLRDILAEKRGTEVSINVTSTTETEAKRIQTFVTMTGCRAEVERSSDGFIVHITGTPCCI